MNLVTCTFRNDLSPKTGRSENHPGRKKGMTVLGNRGGGRTILRMKDEGSGVNQECLKRGTS